MIRAYEEQMAAIETLGGKLIVMASRALARVATSPADYERVYDRILSQARQPVILHWLGDMFDPALAGYWGSARRRRGDGHGARRHRRATPARSTASRSRCSTRTRRSRCAGACPPGVRMYTGDDFNYAELIAGDGVGSEPNHRHSDALLGIFDAIAPAASAALGELAQGNVERFHAILAPDRAAVAPHLRRRRRASTRPASCSWPG